jgi:ERCC4-type nuclease
VILVDRREGSHELVAPLEARGLEVAETELPAGDVAWTGRGIGGTPVEIGIEFKTLTEMIESLRTERLQEQVMKMRGAEPGQRPLYDFAWLIFEGEVIFDKAGRLMKRIGKRDFVPLPGRMTHQELIKRLMVLQLCAGVAWINTESQRETLDYMEAMYRVWTDKNLDEHGSHVAIYQPEALVPISDFRKTVSSACFPGISIRKSIAVERRFKGSLRKAVNASAAEWAEIEVKDAKGNVKRLGMSIAAKIQEKIS